MIQCKFVLKKQTEESEQYNPRITTLLTRNKKDWGNDVCSNVNESQLHTSCI